MLAASLELGRLHDRALRSSGIDGSCLLHYPLLLLSYQLRPQSRDGRLHLAFAGGEGLQLTAEQVVGFLRLLNLVAGGGVGRKYKDWGEELLNACIITVTTEQNVNTMMS